MFKDDIKTYSVYFLPNRNTHNGLIHTNIEEKLSMLLLVLLAKDAEEKK